MMPAPPTDFEPTPEMVAAQEKLTPEERRIKARRWRELAHRAWDDAFLSPAPRLYGPPLTEDELVELNQLETELGHPSVAMKQWLDKKVREALS